jgi:hypothetical protein
MPRRLYGRYYASKVVRMSRPYMERMDNDSINVRCDSDSATTIRNNGPRATYTAWHLSNCVAICRCYLATTPFYECNKRRRYGAPEISCGNTTF